MAGGTLHLKQQSKQNSPQLQQQQPKAPKRKSPQAAAVPPTKKTSSRTNSEETLINARNDPTASSSVKKQHRNRKNSSSSSSSSSSATTSPATLSSAFPTAVPPPLPFASTSASTASFSLKESGSGTPQTPFRQPLRCDIPDPDKQVPNSSGCWHCPTDSCRCQQFSSILQDAHAQVDIKRETDGKGGRKDLCAKSLQPNFVARLIREMPIQDGDTFFDFGSGNGSVLFQVALCTNAKRIVGIELVAHNAELSRRLWNAIKPQIDQIRQQANLPPTPQLEIITGDVLQYLSERSKTFNAETRNSSSGNGPVIVCSNLLFPRAVTHYLQERCRDMEVGTRICCFDDFFPHGRTSMMMRDPEAFQLFEMRDYVWPRGSVEWTDCQEGNFFIHRKVKNRNQISV